MFSFLFSILINGLSQALHHCRFFSFVDDIKLLMQLTDSLGDSQNLQCDFDNFVTFFDTFGLSLNLANCKDMTFNRIRSSSLFSSLVIVFIIFAIQKYHVVMNFGFKFFRKFNTRLYIEMVYFNTRVCTHILLHLHSNDFHKTRPCSYY